jgi:hypothetical protein
MGHALRVRTALDATAFPGWYFRVVCASCGPRVRDGYVSQTGLMVEGWGNQPVRNVVRQLRCKQCRAGPALVELLSGLDMMASTEPIRRIRLR